MLSGLHCALEFQRYIGVCYRRAFDDEMLGDCDYYVIYFDFPRYTGASSNEMLGDCDYYIIMSACNSNE